MFKILNIPVRAGLEIRRVQSTVFQWAKKAFGYDGRDDEVSPGVRALRFYEEATELMQTEGIDPNLLKKQIDEVYSRPVGSMLQEFGGVGITLLAYGESREIDVIEAWDAEIDRINSKPVEHFQQRQREKMEKGLRP